MKSLIAVIILVTLASGCNRQEKARSHNLTLRHNQDNGTISVFRNDNELLLTQNAQSDVRPYIHPIMAPDGNGVLTEFRPAHHKHQTGLYWGLKKVNGRDYFMNWQGDYWRRVSADIIAEKGPMVKWQSVYDLLDEKSISILTETQTWSMHETDGRFILDLEWRGEARTDVTLEQFYVGGLFLRMPWHEGIDGEVINAEGKRNSEAEGQRAIWNDIGIRIDGRKDKGHVAILDHSDNADFPIAWRVDNELGVGPSRQILGDWSIEKGATEVIRYRLVIYTGEFNRDTVTRWWKDYTGN